MRPRVMWRYVALCGVMWRYVAYPCNTRRHHAGRGLVLRTKVADVRATQFWFHTVFRPNITMLEIAQQQVDTIALWLA